MSLNVIGAQQPRQVPHDGERRKPLSRRGFRARHSTFVGVSYRYLSHRYGATRVTVTAVTISPYLVNCQKLIGAPLRAAMPSTTTLAAAPTAVALPPRSAPNASAHHSTCADSPPPACTSSATIGLIVATNGMLSTIAETTADPNSSPIVVSSGCPAVASTAA